MNPSSVVITGATSGLGRATAEILARDAGLQVVLACRDTERADALRAQMARRAANPVLVAPLDLASLASVRAFPRVLGALAAPPLAALVCNAGVQDVGGMQRTTDGFERTFGVNHLGHFALTRLLLDRLARDARVLVVSSNTHDPATKTGLPAPRYRGGLALAAGADEGADLVEAGRVRYTTSKLCNVYFARELARRLASAGDPRLRSVRVAAFDPGMMPGTGLAREYNPFIRFAWSYLLPVLTLTGSNVNTVRRSAGRLAALVSASDPAWPSGAYVSRGVVTPPSTEALDQDRARELWESSEALTSGARPSSFTPSSTAPSGAPG